MSTTLSQTALLVELEPVVAKQPGPPPVAGQGVVPARVRAVERGAHLRRAARRGGWSRGRLHDARRGPDGADRQPADRGQPALVPPRDRHPVRPGRRVGDLGAPVDRRGGPARHRHPRLPDGHPGGRPGGAGAGPDDAHVRRLRQRARRRDAALAGVRRRSRSWPPGSRTATPARPPATRSARRCWPGSPPTRTCTWSSTATCSAAAFELAPSQAMRAVADVVADFQMPGSGIDGLRPQVGGDRPGRHLRPAPAPRRGAAAGAAPVGRLQRRGPRTPTAKPPASSWPPSWTAWSSAAARFEEKRDARAARLAAPADPARPQPAPRRSGWPRRSGRSRRRALAGGRGVGEPGLGQGRSGGRVAPPSPRSGAARLATVTGAEELHVEVQRGVADAGGRVVSARAASVASCQHACRYRTPRALLLCCHIRGQWPARAYSPRGSSLRYRRDRDRPWLSPSMAAMHTACRR